MPRRLERGLAAWEGALDRSPRSWAVLCGTLATLAMPPLFAWPVMFAALFGLVRLMDLASARTTPGRDRVGALFVLGWMFGFGYFAAGLYWISASLLVEPDKFLWLLPFSASLIPAGLAIYHGLALAAVAFVWRPGPARIVALGVALTIAEWLRGHLFTGLPWNTLGYALTAPPLLLQAPALLGVTALTFVTVLVFALPACARDAAITPVGRRTALGLPAAALVLLALHGGWRLSLPDPPDVAGVRLRLVQPNVSQDMKWRHENRSDIFRAYLDQSRRDPTGRPDDLAGITHVIWPESAVPFLLLGSADALEAIAGILPDGTSLITGAIRIEQSVPGIGGYPSDAPPRRRLYNSLLALDDRARLTGVYDKLHLVPFGEYLPFQATLEAWGLEQITRFQGGFSTGRNTVRYWEVPGLPPISPLICYESIFPDEVVTRGRRPGFFLNVTNDGWFGRTAGPHQHFHQARVRAVEQGLPLIRVGNTGISGVVDAKGRVLRRTALGQAATLDSNLPGAGAPTPHARFGHFITVLMLAGALLAWRGLSSTGRRPT